MRVTKYQEGNKSSATINFKGQCVTRANTMQLRSGRGKRYAGKVTGKSSYIYDQKNARDQIINLRSVN